MFHEHYSAQFVCRERFRHLQHVLSCSILSDVGDRWRRFWAAYGDYFVLACATDRIEPHAVGFGVNITRKFGLKLNELLSGEPTLEE